MNSRALGKSESIKLGKLSESGLECALIYLTETGLKKSILDATTPVRELLKENGIHDYSQQAQGDSSKVILNYTLFDELGTAVNANISLYRPKTKKGDPRIWPYRLQQFANPNDVLAIFVQNQRIYLQNLSVDPVVDLKDSTNDLETLLSSLKGAMIGWPMNYSLSYETLLQTALSKPFARATQQSAELLKLL